MDYTSYKIENILTDLIHYIIERGIKKSENYDELSEENEDRMKRILNLIQR